MKVRVLLILLLVVGLGFATFFLTKQGPEATNFEECVAAGNPVMESYPRQCRTPEGTTFVEQVSVQNHAETSDPTEPTSASDFLVLHPKGVDFSVNITGKDLKQLTFTEVADLWEIDAETLLQAVVDEYDLGGVPTIHSTINSISFFDEHHPRRIKELAENSKSS
ncbi:MAG: hypothetical protein GOV00_00685 [Candidatus Altiarchaeota archaeon]|nr:hypothetical protein [Candidatus Altiarchaeota archaeon]